jgi:hypothetical protein
MTLTMNLEIGLFHITFIKNTCSVEHLSSNNINTICKCGKHLYLAFHPKNQFMHSYTINKIPTQFMELLVGIHTGEYVIVSVAN